MKDKYKYKSQHIADKAAEDLYAALFTTEKDGNEVKDILIPNDDNLLSLKDRGRILYVLDYLRIA
ncbi:hypothetical protein J6T66_05970 [bacterium]|nr:hypothetical protein [bacterium]